MIRELIEYMKHLEQNSPQILEESIKPSLGLHILVELDNNGDAINFPGEKGKDWDYYDGKNMSDFIKKIKRYERLGRRIGTNMNKVFDRKKQIFSCSPFIVSFKKKSLNNKKLKGKNFEKITNLLDFYFKKSKKECFFKKNDFIFQKIDSFQNFLVKNIKKIDTFENFNHMKKEEFINIYLKISESEYDKTHKNYLKRNLFNKNDYNTEEEITDNTFGLSSFFNSLNEKKPFLKHLTAPMYKGISYRITSVDSVYLYNFSFLLQNKIFPNPLPVFINKDEFKNLDDIIKIFKEDGKLSYTQIIKKLFEENNNRVLQNYYLLFFSGNKIEDFDYVYKFRYFLNNEDQYPEIKNILKLKKDNNIIPNLKIENIFLFEAYIIKTIFNNSLVRTNNEKNSYSVHYFGKIDPQYVNGGDKVYQMVMKYRKAFYDYIYKSKTEAINSFIWDEVMWNSIISDLKNDSITNQGYHSKEYTIKEKLNIWFSLYNYFGQRRTNMASKIPELIEKIREVANNDNKHFVTVEEFVFGSGQIIYYLLNKSKTSEKTHALLEPFLQKVNAKELQKAITQAFNMYKHEISFGHGRFERLAKEVLAFETNENLKDYQRFLLAGYFSESVIYEAKPTNTNITKENEYE